MPHGKPEIPDVVKMSSKDILYAFDKLLTAKKEYENAKEHEATERERIHTHLQEALAKIQLARDIIEQSLENQFNERRSTIDGIFERIDRALSSDKDEIAIAALNSLEGIVKSSPLGSALAVMRMTLEDPNSTLEI